VLVGDAWQSRGKGAERLGVYDRIEHGPADVLLEADQNLAVQAAAIARRARLQPRVQVVRDVLQCQCRHEPPLWNRNGSILAQNAHPYPGEQDITERENGSIVVRLCVCDDRSLRAWILGFGAMATVLSPKKLAQGIYEELDAARERYAPRLKFEMLRHPSSRIANLASRFTARVG
jgi:WYL domain